MKCFKDIYVKQNVIEYLNNIEKKALLVYSPTSAQKINLLDKLKNKKLTLFNTHVTDIDVTKINDFLELNNEIELVVGFGGGTAIDIAKYIGNKIGVSIVAIPSMLSTNVYSTDKVLMSENNKVNTLDAKLPDLIVYDEEVLRLSSIENLYGFADVLTIYTASRDWVISYKNKSDRMDDAIYKMDIDLLNDTMKYILNNSYETIRDGLFEMFNFIGTVGHITNLFGSGRPVSGSEHIFAKALEQRILVPHGISVGLGILIMSLYQNNYTKEIEQCFEKLRIFDYAYKYNVDKKLIFKNLNELQAREGRYTIVNTLEKDNMQIKDEINRILDKFKIREE